MKCPVCPDVTLVMADRQGIEIDYCPQCRGVWLDRGELDKIIERSANEYARPYDTGQHKRDDDYQHKRDDDYRKPKKRKGLLNELLDF